jgi:hypothetical protein
MPVGVRLCRVSVSIYYRARRARDLDDREQAVVTDLLARYATDRFIEDGGEGFDLYERTEPDDAHSGPDRMEILAGATKLPLPTVDAFWEAVQHWSDLLSAMRRALPDAEWTVSIDDHELAWDDHAGEYDLTR